MEVKSLHFTLDDIEFFAFGELGLLPFEFDRMSWAEYCYYSYGYFIRQARQREPLRLIAYIDYCANSSEKNKMSIHDFMPLITDEKREESKEDKAMDYAERMYRAQRMADEMNLKSARQFEKSMNKKN